ncbi:hypothetical protein C5167_012714 [Papaver somniferum]|uniref:Uncharacterized protein n=1 Tax=Papaver somniferum TaxID=3469 RepID=A0A4Y7J1F1_PAPSO|nr:hypothetical protein C5167_012714 [Papaver somniferum]
MKNVRFKQKTFRNLRFAMTRLAVGVPYSNAAEYICAWMHPVPEGPRHFAIHVDSCGQIRPTQLGS